MRITILLVLISTSIRAQLQTLDMNSAGIGNNGSVRYFNPAALGGGSGLSYSEIRGRYMFADEWQPAKVILKKGQEFYLKQVKLNIYSKDVHYINKEGKELAVSSGIIKAIHFYNAKDTTHKETTFESYIVKNEEFFFQVLTDGKAQFLKRVVSTLQKGNYDPLLGKAEHRFVTNTDYFVQEQGDIQRLAGLNKESLSKIIQLTPQLSAWLNENKNRLKKENDFIAFFEHYNGKR